MAPGDYLDCQQLSGTACACIYIDSPSIPIFFVAQAVIYTMELLVCFTGLILNFAFICRNKTNFLVRVFAYSSIPVLFMMVISWLDAFPAFKPEQPMVTYCFHVHLLYFPGLGMSLWIMIILSCTISIVLLVKLCSVSNACDCCSRRDRSFPRLKVCLEVLFVVLTIILPFLFILIYAVTFWLMMAYANIPNEHYIVDTVEYVYFYGWYIGFVLLVPLTLGFISDVILAVWFCIARRQVANLRRGAILKEIVLFFVHLLVTILATLFFSFLFMEMFDVDGGRNRYDTSSDTVGSLSIWCIRVHEVQCSQVC